ncbi:hypothetical protein GW915_06265 [bacterium]|nr:hypothetical protein [bacterium]
MEKSCGGSFIFKPSLYILILCFVTLSVEAQVVEKSCPAGTGGTCCAANRYGKLKVAYEVPQFTVEQITQATDLPHPSELQTSINFGGLGSHSVAPPTGTTHVSQAKASEASGGGGPKEEVLFEFLTPSLDSRYGAFETPYKQNLQKMVQTAFALGMKHVHGYQPMQSVPFFQFVAKYACDSPMGHLMLYDFYRSFSDKENQEQALSHLSMARSTLESLKSNPALKSAKTKYKAFDQDDAVEMIPEELWFKYVALHGAHYEMDNELRNQQGYLGFLESKVSDGIKLTPAEEKGLAEIKPQVLALEKDANGMEASYRMALADIVGFERVRTGSKHVPRSGMDAALLLGHTYYQKFSEGGYGEPTSGLPKEELSHLSKVLPLNMRSQQEGDLAHFIYQGLETRKDDSVISRHPGLAHYRIHLDEKPSDNTLTVLEAAKIIAENGRGIAHFHHMSAHIFHDEEDFKTADLMLSKAKTIDDKNIKAYLSDPVTKDRSHPSDFWNHLHNIHFRSINAALRAAALSPEDPKRKEYTEAGLKDLAELESIVLDAQKKGALKNGNFEYMMAARSQFHRLLGDWKEADLALESYGKVFRNEADANVLSPNGEFHVSSMRPYIEVQSLLSGLEAEEIDDNTVDQVLTANLRMQKSIQEAPRLMPRDSFNPPNLAKDEVEQLERLAENTFQELEKSVKETGFRMPAFSPPVSREMAMNSYPPSENNSSHPLSGESPRGPLAEGAFRQGPLDAEYSALASLELNALSLWFKARRSTNLAEKKKLEDEARQSFQQAVLWEETRVQPIGFSRQTQSLDRSPFLKVSGLSIKSFQGTPRKR